MCPEKLCNMVSIIHLLLANVKCVECDQPRNLNFENLYIYKVLRILDVPYITRKFVVDKCHACTD